MQCGLIKGQVKESSSKPDKTSQLDGVLNLTQNANIKQQEGPWALNRSSNSFSGDGDVYHKIKIPYSNTEVHLS